MDEVAEYINRNELAQALVCLWHKADNQRLNRWENQHDRDHYDDQVRAFRTHLETNRTSISANEIQEAPLAFISALNKYWRIVLQPSVLRRYAMKFQVANIGYYLLICQVEEMLLVLSSLVIAHIGFIDTPLC